MFGVDDRAAEGAISCVGCLPTDASGSCVLCTSCSPAAKKVPWESCPHAGSCTGSVTTTYHCSAFALTATQKQITVVTNPLTPTEPPSIRCVSEAALRALWLAACLSFTFKQYVSVSQGWEEKLGISSWVSQVSCLGLETWVVNEIGLIFSEI